MYKVSEYTFDKKNHHWFLPETNFETVQRVECFETATQKLSAQLDDGKKLL